MAHYLQTMYDFKGELATCDDIVDFGACHVAPIFRASCPVACLCDHPDGPATNTPEDGCPSSCQETDRHEDAVTATSCVESTPEQLRNDPNWQIAASAMASKFEMIMDAKYLKQRKELCVAGGGSCEDAFLLLGCGAIPNMSRIMENMVGSPGDMCGTGVLNSDAGMVVRPLATRCPVTCQCVGTDEDAATLVSRKCPGQCAGAR